MRIIMATANRAIPTQPGRLTVDFEDISMLRDIKKAISMVRGRVYEYDSLDDLIKEIEG